MIRENIFERFEMATGMDVKEFFQAFTEYVMSEKGMQAPEDMEMRPGETEAGDYEMDSEEGPLPRMAIHAGGMEDDPFLAAQAMEDSYYDDDMYDDVEEELRSGEFAINSGYEAFPGRRAFSLEDVNAEDPGFWRGKEIGIPINLAVRITPDQGLQLPMAGRGPAVRYIKG